MIKWKEKKRNGMTLRLYDHRIEEWRRLKATVLLSIQLRSSTSWETWLNSLRIEFFIFFFLVTHLVVRHLGTHRRLLSLFITIHQSWHSCGFHIHRGLGFLSFPMRVSKVKCWLKLSALQLAASGPTRRQKRRGKCGRLNNEKESRKWRNLPLLSR